MTLLEIVLIAVGLAMDCFAVAIASSVNVCLPIPMLPMAFANVRLRKPIARGEPVIINRYHVTCILCD